MNWYILTLLSEGHFPRHLKILNFISFYWNSSSIGLHLGEPPGNWFLIHLTPCLTSLYDEILSGASLDTGAEGRIFIFKVCRKYSLCPREPKIPHLSTTDKGLACISKTPFQVLVKLYNRHLCPRIFCRSQEISYVTRHC